MQNVSRANQAWKREAEHRILREERRILPSRSGALMRPVGIYPIGGQTLGTSGAITSYGIKKYAGILAGITTQTYDPGTCNPVTGVETGAPSPARTAWPDGLGFGDMWDGVAFSRVIIVNDSRGCMAGALAGGASDDTTYLPTSSRPGRMVSQEIAYVTKADGSLEPAYVPLLG